VIQMTPNQAEAVLRAKPTTLQRALEILGRIKYAACLPLAWRRFRTFECAGTRGLTCIAWRGGAIEIFPGLLIWQEVCQRLIDTYNHERFIEQAIVSVLEQDFAQRIAKSSWWMMADRPHAGNR